MSVLIKGMEMPKICNDCPLHFYEGQDIFSCRVLNAIEIDEELKPWKRKRKDCPLVEVPTPHGRLIDADALMLKIKDYIDEYSELDENGLHDLKWCAMKEAEMSINDAQTIIEAEDGE